MARSRSYSHRKMNRSKKQYTSKPSKRHHGRFHWFRRRHASPPCPPRTATLTENSNSYDNQRGTSSSSRQPDSNPPHDFPPSYNSINSTYTPPAYIPVAPLPIFCGNLHECPVAHLSRFDRVCQVNNAASPASAAHIFPASLDSYAGIWYDLFIDPSLPWGDVRAAFISAFRPPGFSSYAWAELKSLRQFDGEAVNRYHLRMLWILKRWPEHGMSDSILKEIFIDGLREDLKELVTPQRVVTLEETVSLAAMWEQADGIREARRNAFKKMKCDFCGVEGHEENTCEMKRRLEAVHTSKAENALVVMNRLNSRRSNTQSVQCQCQQHLCSKKPERNQSMRSRNPCAVEDSGT